MTVTFSIDVETCHSPVKTVENDTSCNIAVWGWQAANIVGINSWKSKKESSASARVLTASEVLDVDGA